jgi:hypothetical protein
MHEENQKKKHHGGFGKFVKLITFGGLLAILYRFLTKSSKKNK